MGEYADMIIEGCTCACGEFIGDAVGYPRFCSEQCKKDYGGSEQEEEGAKKVACPNSPACERLFRTRRDAAQHWVDKHRSKNDQQGDPTDV
jgi:hypothetical protein